MGADKYGSQVTFSGLLNTLDGVVSTEQRVVFMTTNHKERLDPALLRPGRVDLALYVGDATPEQAGRLFLRFYESEHSLSDRVAGLIAASSHPISMAALQGHFMRYKTSPRDALDNFHLLLSKKDSSLGGD
jgi:chaperone BCS1